MLHVPKVLCNAYTGKGRPESDSRILSHGAVHQTDPFQNIACRKRLIQLMSFADTLAHACKHRYIIGLIEDNDVMDNFGQ